MKSLKWSICFISALFIQQAIADEDPIQLINDAIGQELEVMAIEKPEIRADITSSKIDNMVLYWGQGDFGEKRLAYYCEQEGVTMVMLSFVVDYVGGPRKSPIINLSDNCNNVDNCVEAALDIKFCQSKGIKVLMSVGGAVGPYHKQTWDPDLFAWWMWNKFLAGTDKTVSRPFGNVILDGVDYDPEMVDGVGYDRHIDTLRTLFKTHYPPRQFLITAAPQCPDLDYYPKNAAYNILHPAPKYDAYPDMVFVQFYNNACAAANHISKKVTRFNFDVWDRWSQERTNGRTKIYLGVLGKDNHMDTGYVGYEKLTVILDDIRRSKNFGGVMFWDAGYVYANPVPYLRGLNLGQATARYLKQLTVGPARTAAAFDTINVAFKNYGIPILVPINPNSDDFLSPIVPCAGQSFMLLRSVSGKVLAESFGAPPDVVDSHLEGLGMDGDDPINPGSRICLNPFGDTVKIGYVYNATFDDDSNYPEFYQVSQNFTQLK